MRFPKFNLNNHMNNWHFISSETNNGDCKGDANITAMYLSLSNLMYYNMRARDDIVITEIVRNDLITIAYNDGLTRRSLKKTTLIFSLFTVTRIIALHYYDVIMLMATRQVTRVIIRCAMRLIASRRYWECNTDAEETLMKRPEE